MESGHYKVKSTEEGLTTAKDISIELSEVNILINDCNIRGLKQFLVETQTFLRTEMQA